MEADYSSTLYCEDLIDGLAEEKLIPAIDDAEC